MLGADSQILEIYEDGERMRVVGHGTSPHEYDPFGRIVPPKDAIHLRRKLEKHPQKRLTTVPLPRDGRLCVQEDPFAIKRKPKEIRLPLATVISIPN
jgi:hypothetical protein